FFLLCAPFREEQDLRLSHLEQCAGHLDRIRRRLVELLRDSPGKAAGKPETDAAPGKALRAAFEARMNDNLDYAGALDAVAEKLMAAAGDDAAASLSSGQRAALRAAVAKIDGVLGVLGPI